MEWAPSSLTSSSVSQYIVAENEDDQQRRSSVTSVYILKLNALDVSKDGNIGAFETVNAATARHTSLADENSVDQTSPDLDLMDTGIGPSFTEPVTVTSTLAKAQGHLSSARYLLQKRKVLQENSQNYDHRMGLKRKVNDEGVEIRKSYDRPYKRPCHEATRDQGALFQLEPVKPFIQAAEASTPSTKTNSHTVILPVIRSLCIKTSIDDRLQSPKVPASILKGAFETRKSRLSECFTAIV